MAADSAITVSNGRGVKIYNTETKIFNLSDENPIGVMFYNRIDFMGTPWDIIFNLYRKERGDRAFASVQGYAEEFIRFLRDHDYFSSEESREAYLMEELTYYYEMIKSDVVEQMEETEKDEDDLSYLSERVKCVINQMKELYSDDDICEEFKNYSKSEFQKMAKEYIDSLAEAYEENLLTSETRAEWEDGFYTYLCTRMFENIFSTGLVFVGYGKNDIFPSVFPLEIGGVIDHRLRYYFDISRADKITNENSACILPFAQGDVMMTMMKGIAPDMFASIVEEVQSSMEEAVQKVAKELGIADDDKIKSVASPIIDELHEQFIDNVNDIITDKFTSGLIDTVEFFNVEDMVNMAESLISVTNLQRHITSSEESVGGPIDVAVITKTDGFKWARKK